MSDESERFVIEPGPDGGFTARKPGVYGVEVHDGLDTEQTRGGFVPLYEVTEPPGKSLPNRADRRRWARQAARTLNRARRRRVVAIAPEEDS